MTLCPYTQLGCDMACKAHQNGTCPFDNVSVGPFSPPVKTISSPANEVIQTFETKSPLEAKRRGRKPKQ